MKLAFVVQRHGLEISGCAELHCRWVAEHMKKYFEVEALTTKSFDYITWKDHYPRGEEVINGMPVKKFSVTQTRNPKRFGRIQNYILENEHRLEDELKWLEEEGPYSPSLIKYINEHQNDYDYLIFFSYRYYHSYCGINSLPQKSILVPTAEHDPVIYLKIFKDLFRKPRAIIYNSVEEKNMINSLFHNMDVLGDIIGVGTEIPSHSDIAYLGFLSEEDKFSALEGALLLMMPSFYESLSMVTLEAWALRIPVLANARCEVLKGQCMRSNAGLFYENYEEFREALGLLISSPGLCEAMGKNGQEYFRQNYTWEVIENKYLSILDQLEKEK